MHLYRSLYLALSMLLVTSACDGRDYKSRPPPPSSPSEPGDDGTPGERDDAKPGDPRPDPGDVPDVPDDAETPDQPDVPDDTETPIDQPDVPTDPDVDPDVPTDPDAPTDPDTETPPVDPPALDRVRVELVWDSMVRVSSVSSAVGPAAARIDRMRISEPVVSSAARLSANARKTWL